MAINKLVFTNDIAVGTTTSQKIMEFCGDFIAWMATNMPGSETMTVNALDPLLGDILSRQWAPTIKAAQVGGSANTIKLIATASAAIDAYVGQRIVLQAGPGALDSRIITAYNSTTKIATVDSNFSATPTASTTYAIFDTWVPQWLKNNYHGYGDSSLSVCGAITFTHVDSNTEWCIAAVQDGSTVYGSLVIGIRQAAAGSGNTVVTGELCRYSPTVPGPTYVDDGETISLTIPDLAGKYKIFGKDYNAGATTGSVLNYGAIKVDNPVKDTDTDAWLMIGGDKTKLRFTTPFNVEPLATTIVLTCEALILEAAGMAINAYTGKIPLGRVWAGSLGLGLRGSISTLVVVPQSYVVTAQMYAIGTDTYYGMVTFDNLILLPGGSVTAVGSVVLLKV